MTNTTDNTQELDKILWQNIQFTELGEFPEKVPDHKNWVNVMGRIYSFEFANAKQAILDWHNKQIEAVLDRLIDHKDAFQIQSGREYIDVLGIPAIESERDMLKSPKQEGSS